MRCLADAGRRKEDTSKTSPSAGKPLSLNRAAVMNVELHDDGAMVGRLRTVPSGAWKALHLLPRRQRRPVRLPLADDFRHAGRIGPGQGGREPEIVQLAEMPHLQALGVEERPTIIRRCRFGCDPRSRQNRRTRRRRAPIAVDRRRERESGTRRSRNDQALLIIVHVAADDEILARRRFRRAKTLFDDPAHGARLGGPQRHRRDAAVHLGRAAQFMDLKCTA